MIYSSVERLEAVHKRTLLKQRFKGNTKLNDQEVKERTDATIKMANVSQESASTVSEWMTSIWNNFDDGSKKLDYYGDVLTKLGAATASSSEEIAEGVRKFAGISNTVGLSYEYAASALATITATTRESADVVGTALRTLFSRFQGLQLGKTLEDGTTLNKYSDALKIAGIDIKAQNGGLKDMDDLLDELIEKWKTLNRDQQMALAQTMGGQRQYAQLVTLLDQGDFFKQNLQTAYGSTGELDKQQKIYEESWQGAQDRLAASFEGLVKTVEDDNFFIALTDGASSFLDSLSAVIEGMGGLKVILPSVAAIMLKIFSPQIVQASQSIKEFFKPTTYKEIQMQLEGSWKEYQAGVGENTKLGLEDETRFKNSQRLLEIKGQLAEQVRNMTSAEKMAAESYVQGIEYQINEVNKFAKAQDEANQKLKEFIEASKDIGLDESSIFNLSRGTIAYTNDLYRQANRARGQGQFATAKELEDRAVDLSSDIYTTTDRFLTDYFMTNKKELTNFQNSAVSEKGISNFKVNQKDAEKYVSELLGKNGTLEYYFDSPATATRAQIDDRTTGIQQIIKNFDKLAGGKLQLGGISANEYVTKQLRGIETNLKGEQTESAAQTINNILEQLELGIKKAIPDIFNFKDSNKIKLLPQTLKDIVNGAKDAANANKNYKTALESLNASFERSSRYITHFETSIETVAKLGSALGSLSIALNSVSSLVHVLRDDSLSFFEKLTSVTMSFSMMMPAITTGARGVLGVYKKARQTVFTSRMGEAGEIALSDASKTAIDKARASVGRKAWKKAGVAERQGLAEEFLLSSNEDRKKSSQEISKYLTVEETATQGLTKATWKQVAANLAHYATVMAYIAIAAIVIAAIVAIGKAIYDSYHQEEIAAEKANEKAQTYKESLEQIIQAQKEFSDSAEGYSKARQELNGLTIGTEKYGKKVLEANQYALKLIDSNKELAKYMSVDTQGLITIDEDQIKKVQEKQAKQAASATYLSSIASMKADRANTIVEIKGEITSSDNYSINDYDQELSAIQELADRLTEGSITQADLTKEGLENLTDEIPGLTDVLDDLSNNQIVSAVTELVSNTKATNELTKAMGSNTLSEYDWYKNATDEQKEALSSAMGAQTEYDEAALREKYQNYSKDNLKDALTGLGLGYYKDGDEIKDSSGNVVVSENMSDEQLLNFFISKAVTTDAFKKNAADKIKAAWDAGGNGDTVNLNPEQTGIDAIKRMARDMGVNDYIRLIYDDDNKIWRVTDGRKTYVVSEENLNNIFDFTEEQKKHIKNNDGFITIDSNTKVKTSSDESKTTYKSDAASALDPYLDKGKHRHISKFLNNEAAANLDDSDKLALAQIMDTGNKHDDVGWMSKGKLEEAIEKVKYQDDSELKEQDRTKILSALAQTDWTSQNAMNQFKHNLEEAGADLNNFKLDNFENAMNDARAQIIDTTKVVANLTVFLSSGVQNLKDGDEVSQTQLDALTFFDSGFANKYIRTDDDGKMTLATGGATAIKGISVADYQAGLTETEQKNVNSELAEGASTLGDLANVTDLDLYAEKLTNMAKQYASCKDELKSFNKVLDSGEKGTAEYFKAFQKLKTAVQTAEYQKVAKEVTEAFDIIKNAADYTEDEVAGAYETLAQKINTAFGTDFTSEFIEENKKLFLQLQTATGDTAKNIWDQIYQEKWTDDLENARATIKISTQIDDEGKNALYEFLNSIPSRKEIQTRISTPEGAQAFQNEIQDLFNKLTAGGKNSAIAVSKALSSIPGVSFKLEWEEKEVPSVVAEMFKKFNPNAKDLGSGTWSSHTKFLVPKLTPTIDKNNFDGAPGTGLNAPSGSGGGGGSKKENKEKDPADKYKSLSNLIDKLKDDLSELAALQDRVWGSDRLQNMDAQIGAIQGIISKYEEYQALIKPDVDSQKNQLINNWGAIVDDNTGTILNYEQVKNKIIDQYNNSAKEEADEKAYDTAIKLLDAYQENANTLNENTKAIKDYKRQVEDLKDAQIEYIQEVAEKTQDLKDSQIDLSRALLEASRDVFGNANLYMSQTFDEFAQGFTKVDMAYSKIADYEKRLSEATDATNIKDLQDKLLEARKEASAAYKEIISLGQKFTEQLKESFDAIIERYKKITDTIDFSSNIGEAVKSMAQLSRLGTKYYAIANKTSELEINNALSRREVAQHKLDRLKGEIAEADQDIANAATEFDRKEAQTRKDMYVEQAREAQLEIINSGKDALEAAQNQYEEQIEGALKAFEEAATRGAGFDFIKQLFDDFVSNEDEYLDPVNKKYDLETLDRKLQTEINKSDSKYRSNLLRSLQKEFDIRNKNHKLSEYDLEIMNKKYDITMKQIALEEARNSKTNMQLVRNAAGNWSYIFTNDEDNVSDAEQALADSQKEYWNTAKQEMLDIASRRVEAESQFRDKISAIAENENLTSAEKDRQYEVTYREWYLPLIKTLETKFNIATADLGDAEDLANVDYADDFTRGLLEKLPDQLSEDAARTLFDEVTNIEKTSSANIEDIKRKVKANIGNIDTNLNQAKELTEQSKEELNNIDAAWDDYESTLNDIVKPSLRTMSNCLRNIEQVLVKGDLLAYKENVDYAALIRDKIEGNSNYYGSAEYERDLRKRDAKLNMMSRTGELSANMIDQTTDYTALARAYKEVFGADSIYQQILAEADFKGAVAQWLNIDPKGSWTSKNRADILNKLKEVGIVQYDTGGYTGEFNNGGLAILHEKELVLNKDDTSNLLNTVDIINKLDKEVVAGLALMLQKASGGRFLDGLDTRKIEQDVKIEAHFPNVTSAEEIKLSLNNLVNEAAQRAGTY